MDKALIGRKLERAEEYIKNIRQKKDPGLSLFVRNSDLQSIILFNLIQAIQACVDIGSHIIADAGLETPSTLAEIFEILAREKIINKRLASKMVQMAGFRNRIVHEYEKIDIKIVHEVWIKHSADIEKFCKVVVGKFKL